MTVLPVAPIAGLSRWRGSPGATRRNTVVLLLSLLTVATAITASAGAAHAASNHRPVGSIDSAAFLDGMLHVQGWAFDPDGHQSIRVQLRVDGVTIASPVASIRRADVASHYPKAGPAHGFTFSVSIADGRHTVCVVGVNIKAGSSRSIGCRAVTANNNPIGLLDPPQLTLRGVLLSGWIVDPNTKGSVAGVLYSDGRAIVRTRARSPRTSGPAAYYGPNHGFSLLISLPVGTHQICLTAINLGRGTVNPRIGCSSITVTHDPIGVLQNPVPSITTANAATITGWALDPDDPASITVQPSVDGVLQPTAVANQPSPASLAGHPNYGAAHGFSIDVALPDGNQHRICLTLLNVGTGANTTLPCQLSLSTGDLTPSPVAGLSGWPGNGTATLTWSAPRSVTSPVSQYVVSGLPAGQVLSLTPDVQRVYIPGLKNGVSYTFAIHAYNGLGSGSAATVSVTPSLIPPQFTPAPISTSHYPRNLTGNVAADAAMARAQGVRDAQANPSSHRYLILQDIGGQDELHGGVLLSATSIFRSYAQIVATMQAYTDGYASAQKPYAPLLLAVGTNNDIDVSNSAGVSWAQNVINPLANYVRTHHSGIEIAGADDIEPGFSAGVAASRAWLSGYLANTGTRFVFNGSADGCSTVTASSRCNNGWTMADLQWLSGGAAPNRIVSLPQIYNKAMPLQWKFISLTGANAGKPRVYFGGPLTEYTACGGRCYSITGHDAWSLLWGAISSSPATAQYELPYSTDLMIN